MSTIVSDHLTATFACSIYRMQPMRGVAVLLPNGDQIALFLLDDNTIHAIDNIDPIAGAAVLSRGIVGDRAGHPVVQSPLKKQAFSLLDGHCLDQPDTGVTVHHTRIDSDGSVYVLPAR